MIYCFVTDLIFQSQLRVAAVSIHVPIQFVYSIDSVSKPISLAIFDLSSGDLSSLKLFLHTFSDSKTIGFLRHVDTAIKEEALRLGCTNVIARSEFFGNIREILSTTN